MATPAGPGTTNDAANFRSPPTRSPSRPAGDPRHEVNEQPLQRSPIRPKNPSSPLEEPRAEDTPGQRSPGTQRTTTSSPGAHSLTLTRSHSCSVHRQQFPTPGIARFAREDVTIAQVAVPRGATVLVASAVADRDPARFPDPDCLDITRQDNAHLAFGHGIHYCLGAPLARLEGQIAIGTALRRLPRLSLAVPPGELRWRAGGLRGPEQLPVTFTSDGTG
ncbi:cytochrome P450 [Streptomyces sp. NPDC048275]|uniref:cytochrome P450 n=1 Tax=Streptomyces sp. NPDC048275 TaxID=3155629 RepID=UPI003405B06D